MIWITDDGEGLILDYQSEFNEPEWVTRRLDERGEVTVSAGFTFRQEDLLEPPPEPDDDLIRFRLARTSAGYHRIPGRILRCERDVLIATDGMPLDRRLFVAERNIRIFPCIEKMMGEPREIVVGGSREDAIPADLFLELLAKFPSSGELHRYARARIETILEEALEGNGAARANYETYVSRRGSSVSSTPLPQPEIVQAEIDKFLYVRATIADWLSRSDSYTEEDWRKLIVKVILLLLPKYVAVLETVRIRDFYSRPDAWTPREIDVCLVDAGGNIDVIEIKKPFDDVLLGRTRYRDNHVPTRTLSGIIMQAEKYLFHLSKWGVDGEAILTARYADKLPSGMKLKVTSPKAIVLLGRDRRADGTGALGPGAFFDLEIIKRKYSNVVDIMTYDDLLRRLDNTIELWTKRKAELA